MSIILGTNEAVAVYRPLMACLAMAALFGAALSAWAGSTEGADLRQLAGQEIKGTDLHWKFIDALVEWGFKEGTDKLAFDGTVECTYGQGKVGKVATLDGDTATTLAGDAAWKSPAAGTARRGIVVPILYADALVGPGQTIITVHTGSCTFSFRPIDLEGGPILAPEFGFFVANTASRVTAKEFQKDLAAKNLKTIRQRVREHREQTWENAVRAVNDVKAFPPFPKAPYEPAMSIEIPDPYLTALWRIGAWQIIRNCPKIRRADIKKVGKAQLFARQIPEQCEVVKDPNDPQGVYVVPDHPFAPLGGETDRILWALDHLGMHDVARDGISIWLENQKDDGCLTLGSDIDTNQHKFGALNILWVMAEHYKLTGNQEWLKAESPRLKAAAQWIIARRKTTMKEKLSREETEGFQAGTWPPYGLQPRISMGDGDSAGRRCYFLNDGFALRSIRELGEALAEIDPSAGLPLIEEAARYSMDIAKALDKAIALSPVMKVRDGTYHSFVPLGFQDHGPISKLSPKGTDLFRHCGIFSSDIVGSSAEIECFLRAGLLAADDPRIDGHFDVLEDVFLSDNPWLSKRKKDYDPEKDWFSNAGWGYQAGWEKVPEYYLLRDDIPNFIRSFLNHCAVDVNIGNGRYTFNEHTFFADNDKSFEYAIFLSNLRNMLVYEMRSVLWLARATPRAWLEDRKRISVKNAPTYFGTVAYEIVSDLANRRITATIELPARRAPEAVSLRLRHPDAAPIQSVTVNGKPWTDFNPAIEAIRLHGLTGTASVVAAY